MIGAGLVGPGLGVGLVIGLLTGATYRRTGEAAPGHVGHGGAAKTNQTIAIIGTSHMRTSRSAHAPRRFQSAFAARSSNNSG